MDGIVSMSVKSERLLIQEGILTGSRDRGDMVVEREANYAWVSNQNLSKFEGKWIGIVDQKLIDSGNNASDVVKTCREKYPGKTPFIMKVPTSSNFTL
ncbi:MAG TPA: hypothetical protein ENK47_09335 [Euryarchaeota archaeon]|nr:hypothetical protein [Euryarchaeota archaeon]